MEGGLKGVSASSLSTRPIGLRNTNAKIIGGAVNAVMTSIILMCANRCQQGFIKGRDFCTNILSLDAFALSCSWMPEDLFPCTVLFDIAAAFPSVAHNYFQRIFVHYGLPWGLIEVLLAFYMHVYSWARVGSGTTFMCRVSNWFCTGLQAQRNHFRVRDESFL